MTTDTTAQPFTPQAEPTRLTRGTRILLGVLALLVVGAAVAAYSIHTAATATATADYVGPGVTPYALAGRTDNTITVEVNRSFNSPLDAAMIVGDVQSNINMDNINYPVGTYTVIINCATGAGDFTDNTLAVSTFTFGPRGQRPPMSTDSITIYADRVCPA